MSAGRRVVITGIASHWGAELARRLERDPEIDYIAGIDSRPPPAELERTDFIEADIRSPVLSRLLPRDRGRHRRPLRDPLVPRAGQAGPGPARHQRDRDAAAAGRLRAHRRPCGTVVVRGSAAIYGCEGAGRRPSSPRTWRGRAPLRTRFQRDISELEDYFENFARRHPELACCMLRYQPEIGPGLDTPLVRYLSLPVVPTQLGFDPRLQLLHADDATGGARGGRPQARPRRRSTSRPTARSR